jgi:hypothetical protein
MAGLAGLEAMLQSRLRYAALQGSVEIVARVVEGADARIVPVAAWPVEAGEDLAG